jgi:hypothetical protein
MSHPSSRPVVISAAVLGLLAGCSNGGDDADARPPQRSAPEATTTTAAPATIDLSQPIPGGSLHGTPRPPLENTGDDYVAIFESLVANLRWISENPDPVLISDIYVPGTPAHDARIGAYEFLVSNGYRWADEGYYLLSVDVVDEQDALVSLSVTDQFEFERLVDSAGNQVGEVREHGVPETSTVLVSRAADGKWRIADWTRSSDTAVEV